MMKKNFTALIGLSALLTSVPFAPCQSETVFLKGTAYKSGIVQRDLTVGVSEILVANEAIKRIAIADPSIADVRILSDTSAILRGKRVGKTSLLIWEGNGDDARPQKYNLTIRRDITDLIASLKTVDPSITVDYIVTAPTQISDSVGGTHNGPYTTSFTTKPKQIGEPAPSVLVDNSNTRGGTITGGGQAAMEKVILYGKVKNSDSIAKAITIAAAYMGENSGEFKILTRDGGMIVDKLSEVMSLGGGAGGGNDSGISEGLDFASNLEGNLGNGTIITSSSGKVVSMMSLEDRIQIAIKVRFYEVSKRVGEDVKAQFSYSKPNSKFAGAVNAPGGSVANQTIQPIAGQPLTFLEVLQNGALAAGSMWAVLPAANLYGSLEALVSSGAAKVLAEPTIVVVNGEPGLFRVGGELPIQQSTIVGGGTTAAVQNVQYVPFGIGLDILPTLTERDSILMNVRAFTRDVDTNNTFGAIGAPAFITRKVSTQVDMDPTQALILGGLINSQDSQNMQKIPLLGDIPVIGSLFRSKSFSKGETELIIVLSPELVRPASYTQMNRPLPLEHQIDPKDYRWIPRLDVLKSIQRDKDTQINPEAITPPTNGAVDLRRPATMTDLDNVYR